MSDEQWTPVPNSLEYDIVTYAIKTGEIPVEYRICWQRPQSAAESELMADWSQAPEWAMWWAVDPAGWASWYQEEPVMYLTDNYSGWVVRTINGYQQGHDLEAPSIDIPLGIDWRTLLRQRPPQGQEGV